jgi:hypothetical protein
MIEIVVIIIRTWHVILTMDNKLGRLNESFEKKR